VDEEKKAEEADDAEYDDVEEATTRSASVRQVVATIKRDLD